MVRTLVVILSKSESRRKGLAKEQLDLTQCCQDCSGCGVRGERGQGKSRQNTRELPVQDVYSLKREVAVEAGRRSIFQVASKLNFGGFDVGVKERSKRFQGLGPKQPEGWCCSE